MKRRGQVGGETKVKRKLKQKGSHCKEESNAQRRPRQRKGQGLEKANCKKEDMAERKPRPTGGAR